MRSAGTPIPPRDEALARLLRAGGTACRMSAVNWESALPRDHAAGGGSGSTAGDWWEFVAGWGRVAVAASVVAMLVSGLLLWRAISGSSEPWKSPRPRRNPIAIARVATAYPDETAFVSLVRTEHHDEFTAWGVR